MDPLRSRPLDRLLRDHARLIAAFARRYRGMGVPFEDLLSEGRVGVLEAARRWDRNRGGPFARYAVWWIRRQVLRALRFQGCPLSIPDGHWRRMHGDRNAEDDAERPAMPKWFSLSAGRENDEGEVEPLQIADPRAIDPGEDFLREEARGRLRNALEGLPERERRVIRWRYGFDAGHPRSLAAAARRLGVSRERARQIERRARRRLRESLEEKGSPVATA